MHQPRLLAARQRPDLLVDVVAGELEGASQVAQHADRLVGEVLLELRLDGQIGAEHLERLLGEVAQLQAGTEPDVAGVRRHLPGDHLQQRRLAGAVLPHHAPALAAADGHVQAVVDDALAVALAHALEHRHLIAGARRLAEVELDDLPTLGQLDLLDLLQRLDPALHLRGLGGVGGEAVDEALLLGQHRLLAGVGGFAVGLADRPLLLVEVVVAGVDGDLAAVDLGDPGDDAVHELAVVRGHQQRAGRAS